MKKIIFLSQILIFLAFSSYGQNGKTKEVFNQLSNTYNQFNDKFDLDNIEDQVTFIYVPGTNDPFGKFYNRYTGKALKNNVICIGGFKEMMVKMNEAVKVQHLQDALKSRFKEASFSILIDSKSKVQELLSLNGYAIITLSKKSNKIILNENFGFDRAAFFKALKEYLKQ